MVSIRSDLAQKRVTRKSHAPIETPAPRRAGERGLQPSHQRPCGPGFLTRCWGNEMSRLAWIPRAVWCWACVWLGMTSILAHATDTNLMFNRWFEVQTNLQSWSADFTQTRSLKVLSQPLVATGKVWVAVPGRFRWEIGQPAQTIALRQADQLFIIYPKLKRAEKYALSGVPPGAIKDALALLDASLPRDRATMEERFRLLSAMETNSILQMTLEPKSASARKFIGEILIGFRTNDFSIAVTQMKFADGSSLRNDFTNAVLNQPIDPELFEAKLAPDFTVVEPLRR